jgi:hypothetical protein
MNAVLKPIVKVGVNIARMDRRQSIAAREDILDAPPFGGGSARLFVGVVVLDAQTVVVIDPVLSKGQVGVGNDGVVPPKFNPRKAGTGFDTPLGTKSSIRIFGPSGLSVRGIRTSFRVAFPSRASLLLVSTLKSRFCARAGAFPYSSFSKSASNSDRRVFSHISGFLTALPSSQTNASGKTKGGIFDSS